MGQVAVDTLAYDKRICRLTHTTYLQTAFSMRLLCCILVILVTLMLCNASDAESFGALTDSSNSDSDQEEAESSSSTKAGKHSRHSLLWASKQSVRTSLDKFNPDAALAEAGGLRKLITQDGLLSLRSPNFVIWLQQKGKVALREGGAAGTELQLLMEDRVHYTDLEDIKSYLKAKYAASVKNDLLTNGGRASLGTVLLKTRLQLVKHAGAAPTGHGPQVFRLTPDMSRSALKLVDKFEQFSKDAAAKVIRPRSF